jgi:hypothetical protein
MKRMKSAGLLSRQRKRSKALKSGPGLDTTSRESIELFALLLARWDLPREAVWRYLKHCLENLPGSIATTSDESPGITKDQVPGEVLTQWHLLPQYVHDGEPRPLPATGPGPSVASIVRRVSRTARPDEVLKYLLGMGAVKQMGRLYLPKQRILELRLSPRLQRFHHLRVALALLRTLESNARQTSERQYQFTTDGTVPESQLQHFRNEMREASDRTLMLADAAMFRQSQARKRGERGLPVTLGIFMSEGRKLPSFMEGAPQSKLSNKSARKGRKR